MKPAWSIELSYKVISLRIVTYGNIFGNIILICLLFFDAQWPMVHWQPRQKRILKLVNIISNTIINKCMRACHARLRPPPDGNFVKNRAGFHE